MKIGIIGAGSIGLYLGALLHQSGATIKFYVRTATLNRWKQKQGENQTLQVHPQKNKTGHSILWKIREMNFTDDITELQNLDAVFVCTKSEAVSDILSQLKILWSLNPQMLVIPWQNGLRASNQIYSLNPGRVLRGLVGYNVAQISECEYRQTTSGLLYLENGREDWDKKWVSQLQQKFAQTEMTLKQVDNILDWQWSKILLNLNNSINALSGVGLVAELRDRQYRRCLSLAMREAMQLLKAKGIRPPKMAALPFVFVVRLLNLPNFIFLPLAQGMLKMDKNARSSMLDDINAKRPTEVDFINGEVVQLAIELGVRANINQKLIELIRKREEGKLGPMAGSDILQEITFSRES